MYLTDRFPVAIFFPGSWQRWRLHVPDDGEATSINYRQPGVRFEPPLDYFAAMLNLYEVAIVLEYPGKLGWYANSLLVHSNKVRRQPDPHPIDAGLSHEIPVEDVYALPKIQIVLGQHGPQAAVLMPRS
jgi:hypothetical protein